MTCRRFGRFLRGADKEEEGTPSPPLWLIGGLPFQCSKNSKITKMFFFSKSQVCLQIWCMREWNIQHAGLYIAHYHSHPLRAGLVTKWGRSSSPKKSNKSSIPFSQALNLQHLLKKCKKYIIKRDTTYYETFRFA